MKYTLKQAGIALTAVACLAVPATAQNKGKALGQAVEATVGRKVAQQTVKKGYNPVFGYRNFQYRVPYTQNTHIKTTLKEATFVGINTAVTPDGYFSDRDALQIAPVLNPAKGEDAFIIDYTDILEGPEIGETTKLTEALYLWRLAHPRVKKMSEIPLAKDMQKLIESGKLNVYTDTSVGAMDDYPTYLFAKYLLDPNFTPKSFAQLVKETPVYPKHITLNAQGFPEPLLEAKQARMLDIYLMQSKEMGEFYNAHEGNQYTPFILTNEEQQAAKQLKELRAKGDALPDNHPRHLLENIYNQLEREMWPYHDEGWMHHWNDGEITFDYLSYFDYSKTPAGKALHSMVKYNGETAWQHSFEKAHLMVVDSIINKHPKTLSYYNNLLGAFKKLWAEAPKTATNVKHLKVLQRFMVRKAEYARDFEGSEDINAQADEIANLKL